MPTKADPVDFWRALRRACGPLSDRTRRLIKLGGYAGEYAIAQPQGRTRIVERVASHVARYRRTGTWPGRLVAVAPEGPGATNGRWTLLRDLERARMAVAEQAEPGLSYPVVIGDGTGEMAAEGAVGRVVLSIDARLPLDALQRELRKLWPRAQEAGWIRGGRALGLRKLGLLRFVCLEAEPGSSWRALCDAWNAAHPEWAYSSPWALQSDFHRAEVSLVGRKHGLDWHYDPAAREIRGMPAHELARRVRTGDLTGAQRRAIQHNVEWLSLALGSQPSELLPGSAG